MTKDPFSSTRPRAQQIDNYVARLHTVAGPRLHASLSSRSLEKRWGSWSLKRLSHYLKILSCRLSIFCLAAAAAAAAVADAPSEEKEMVG